MTRQNIRRPHGHSGGEPTDGSRSDTRDHSRREFLAILAAFGITAVTPARRLIAQTAAGSVKPGLIDVHHYFIPPSYFAETATLLGAVPEF